MSHPESLAREWKSGSLIFIYDTGYTEILARRPLVIIDGDVISPNGTSVIGLC